MSERAKQFSEAVEQRDALSALLKTPGWEILEEICRVKIAEGDKALDKPLESTADGYAQEYSKGARTTFRYLLALPQGLVDQAVDVIEAIEKEKEDGEDGNGSETGSDGDESGSNSD